eukprot:s3321_g10.t1
MVHPGTSASYRCSGWCADPLQRCSGTALAPTFLDTGCTRWALLTLARPLLCCLHSKISCSEADPGQGVAQLVQQSACGCQISASGLTVQSDGLLEGPVDWPCHWPCVQQLSGAEAMQGR